MKTILTSIAAGSLLAALAIAQTPRYTITDLGTLGGTYSYAYGINDAGEVSGGAATPNQTGGLSETAFLWYNGQITDLGTLGGLACPACNSEAGGPNANGASPMLSETAHSDPNGEDTCGFGTHLQCLGAIWKKGALTALSALPGGHNSQAYWLNDSGQAAGLAENGVRDATCATPFQVLRFEAVIWGPKGEIRELSPLAGDTVGFAFGINNSGQAVGTSGLCSNTTLPTVGPSGAHAVLWEKDGSATDLGNLGGTNNIATTVNDLGEVAGNSQSATDGNTHPFLWTPKTGIHDLGIFPGDFLTVAPCCNTLNDKSQVVGFSCPGPMGSCRAFLWQPTDGVLTDLNTLIPKDSPWYLQAATSINNAGEIVGYGTINGSVHAFLATPK